MFPKKDFQYWCSLIMQIGRSNHASEVPNTEVIKRLVAQSLIQTHRWLQIILWWTLQRSSSRMVKEMSYLKGGHPQIIITFASCATVPRRGIFISAVVVGTALRHWSGHQNDLLAAVVYLFDVLVEMNAVTRSVRHFTQTSPPVPIESQKKMSSIATQRENVLITELEQFQIILNRLNLSNSIDLKWIRNVK